MSDISAYLLSVVGVVFLLVIIELVLPDSKVSKYIKSIYSIFIVVVIITPLAKLINSDWDWNSFFGGNEYTVNQNFIDNINEQNIDLFEQQLEDYINETYEGAKIQISANFEGDGMKLNYIFVDLSGLVINENNQHINYYTAVKELVSKQVNIDEERIIVYG